MGVTLSLVVVFIGRGVEKEGEGNVIESRYSFMMHWVLMTFVLSDKANCILKTPIAC